MNQSQNESSKVQQCNKLQHYREKYNRKLDGDPKISKETVYGGNDGTKDKVQGEHMSHM